MGVIRDLLRYNYYDTPEGEDCFKKIFATAKWGGAIGVFVGYYETIANRHLIPKESIFHFVYRGLTVSVLPCMAVGATWAAATCILVTLRKKDDHWNYVPAGLIGGAVLGACARNPTVGYTAAGAFALAGYIKKFSVEKNTYLITPDPTVSRGQFRNVRGFVNYFNIDWSYIKDYQPRNHAYYFPSTVAPPPADAR